MENGRLRSLWRDYSLGITVGVLFLVSFALHAAFGWLQYAADQADQGAIATLIGPHGFAVYFGEWTFQNWQSEFLEVFVLIVLTSYLVHKGSPESKDGDERLERAIERIEQKIDRLTSQGDETPTFTTTRLTRLDRVRSK